MPKKTKKVAAKAKELSPKEIKNILDAAEANEKALNEATMPVSAIASPPPVLTPRSILRTEVVELNGRKYQKHFRAEGTTDLELL